MPELHLRQPGFTVSASWPFIKRREKMQLFRETGNLKYLYRNELDKNSFAHDAAYYDSKYLAKRTILDKVLKEKAYVIVTNLSKYDGYQRALASMVYKLFWQESRIRSECKWRTSWRIT